MSFQSLITKEGKLSAKVVNVTKKCPCKGCKVTIIGVSIEDPISKDSFIECLMKNGEKIVLRICALLNFREILNSILRMLNPALQS